MAVRLITTCSAKSVYYFGEENQFLTTIINSAYPKVIVNSYNDNTPINQGKFTFNSSLNGKCIWLNVTQKSVGVFSEFDNNNPQYHGLNQKFDLVVMTNYLENIQALYCSGLALSYTYNLEYVNAENIGNLKYYL